MRRTGARPVLKGPRRSNASGLPDSEAQFKTLKYCPAFPGRFGSLADARAFCQTFFNHYNHIHRHKAIGLHTPASVPLRHRRRDPRQPHRRPERRPRPQPRTIQQATDPTAPAHHGVDQPAHTGTPDTDRLTSPCLNDLDSFRSGGSCIVV
jgi:putative transposase